MLKIHINQHNILSNKTKEKNLPVITIKQGSKNYYCSEIEIVGPKKNLLWVSIPKTTSELWC